MYTLYAMSPASGSYAYYSMSHCAWSCWDVYYESEYNITCLVNDCWGSAAVRTSRWCKVSKGRTFTAHGLWTAQQSKVACEVAATALN